MHKAMAIGWLWYAACGRSDTLEPVALVGSYLMVAVGCKLLGYVKAELVRGSRRIGG